jgi:hypothetical protein
VIFLAEFSPFFEKNKNKKEYSVTNSLFVGNKFAKTMTKKLAKNHHNC